VILARCSQVVMVAAVSLFAPAQLASQHLPGSGGLGRRVPANDSTSAANDSTSAATPPKLISWTEEKSPSRAQALSLAGMFLPIAAGAVVLATRPRGDPASGEPADETFDVVGGILICVGVGVGPSLGHFYAHELGWFVPRVLVGGTLGWAAANSDMGNVVGLALLGLRRSRSWLVTISALRQPQPGATTRPGLAPRSGLTWGAGKADWACGWGLQPSYEVGIPRTDARHPARTAQLVILGHS